jgi:hypothetical protein
LDYYRKRLGTGVSKIEILAQLRHSKEGKSKSSTVDGLDAEIGAFLRRKNSPGNKFMRLIGAGRLIKGKKNAESQQATIVEKIPRDIERRAQRFDAQWYLEQNPDVKDSKADPYDHYLRCGKKEGRHPCFDGNWYLTQQSGRTAPCF